MKKLNQESASPPLLRRLAPEPYFHPPFLIFHVPPLGEVTKITKKGGGGGGGGGGGSEPCIQITLDIYQHISYVQNKTKGRKYEL